MCTVTWVREPDEAYALYVSRDEKRTRKPATPPELRESRGVRFLAPRDGDKGGAWVAVNEYGVSFALLNQHDAHPGYTSNARRTRGEIVLLLASSRDCEEAARRLLSVNLSCFDPFVTVCIGPGRPALTLAWNGEALAGDFQAEERQPFVSSSLFPAEAQRARRELFGRLNRDTPTREGLLEFHTSHEPERGPLSPCMHREDAATVSFSIVEVSDAEVRISYRPGAPCEGAAATKMSLARKVRQDASAA